MFRWFSKKNKVDPPTLDFSVLKTDIHSHLIPGLDDGSPNMETTISLIKRMQELGYEKIITTPHIMSDSYKNSSEDILAGLKKVRKEIVRRKLDIKFDSAAEYYIDYDFEKKIGNVSFLTFGDKYILVEMSFIEAPKNLFEIIFKLQLEGLKVVIAHPERYSYLQLQDYISLVERGVFLQINLLSLINYYSPEVRKKTEDLIDNDLVSFVGTDCHNMGHAELYSRCYNNQLWHDLYNSGKLLNSTL